MALARTAFSTLFSKSRLVVDAASKFSRPKGKPGENMVFGFITCNFLSTHRLSKNIELITEDSIPLLVKDSKKVVTENENNRPLLVLLNWLLAKKKHSMKFVHFYTEQGFDVVSVSITPWQLLWPMKGSRLIADELATFLAQNKAYEQILVHGFSVGGYLWGEVLDVMNNDRKRFDPVVQRIVGQIWDSAVDITELPVGFSKAVFPHNDMLQTLVRKYIEYHMKALHNQATQYYIRSSQLFYSSIVRSPALLLLSKVDPIASVPSNMRLRESWDAIGIKTYLKLFEKSPHVGHFHKHPKEYTQELYSFLDKLQLIQNAEKIHQRL